MNCYAIILAAGTGHRLQYSGEYKQFISLKGKPIFIHTVEKFLCLNEFKKIIIVSHKDYVGKTKDLLEQFSFSDSRIEIISGSETRHDSLLKALNFIRQLSSYTKNSIAVTHDAVRPFISTQIIKNNIKAMETHQACDTVFPAQDTIVESKTGNLIDKIPNRKKMYQGQTPQTFFIETFFKVLPLLTKEQINTLSDAIKIFTLTDIKVKLVLGEKINFKITEILDLMMADYLINRDLKIE